MKPTGRSYGADNARSYFLQTVHSYGVRDEKLTLNLINTPN